MKRSLILIPFFLLVILNACDNGRLPQFSQAQWTAIAQTQDGMGVLPEEKIMNWLNAPLPDPNGLVGFEQALLGHYQVNQVLIVPLRGTTNVIQVVVDCQCPSGNSQCFNPDQMFKAIIIRMYQKRYEIIAAVPESVDEMWVVKGAAVSVPTGLSRDLGKSARWVDVKAFLQGNIDGNLFGTLVTPGAVP